MIVRLLIPSNLRKTVGYQGSVELVWAEEGLAKAVHDRYPELARAVFDAQGTLHPFVRLIQEQRVVDLEQINIGPESRIEIQILTAIAGG